MSTSTSTVAVLFLLVTLADAAPMTQTTPGPGLVQAQALVQKVLQSLAMIHAQTVTTPGLTFDPSGHAPNLELMMLELQLPPATVLKPLDPPTFTQDDLLRKMWEGLEQQQRIVGALSSKLSTLSDLSNDLRDLQAQVKVIISSLGVTSPPQDQSASTILSRIDSNFKAQVAAHLTLTTLREFCEDLNRSLRSLSSIQLQG